MRKNLGHNLFTVVLLAGYIWLSLQLYWSGKINYYVHPDLAILTFISAILLLFVLFFVLIVTISNSAQKRVVYWNSIGRLLLVCLPVLLFVLFRPKALSSDSFSGRTLNNEVDLGLSRQIQKPLEFVINTEKRELIDWIRLFAQSPDLKAYNGLKVKLTGFVLKSPEMPANNFTLARFVISCCAADARPVGLKVKYDPAKFNFKSDQWLEVKGKIVIEQQNGQDNPVIELTEAKEIEVPANPYIS